MHVTRFYTTADGGSCFDEFDWPQDLGSTDAFGNELSRMVGYPGEEPFLDWLALADAPPPSPDALSPREAAAKALRKVRASPANTNGG